MRAMVLLIALLGMAACTAVDPVAVIAPDGQVLRGSATSAMSGGTFTVASSRLQCSGNFDPFVRGPTLAVAVHCSDGRSGIGRAIRDSPRSGSGKIKMNDGTEATFAYGAAASGI